MEFSKERREQLKLAGFTLAAGIFSGTRSKLLGNVEACAKRAYYEYMNRPQLPTFTDYKAETDRLKARCENTFESRASTLEGAGTLVVIAGAALFSRPYLPMTRRNMFGRIVVAGAAAFVGSKVGENI